MRPVVVVALLGLALAVPLAAADHCGRALYILGYPVGTEASVNLTPLECEFTSDEVDSRVLPPASDRVRVHFAYDRGVTALPARLDGLGFDDAAIDLHRTVLGISVFYRSGFIPIPDGPAAFGRLEAWVALPDGSTDATVYRAGPHGG